MSTKTPRQKTGRRSKWAAAALIGIGLLVTGGVYAGASAAMAATEPASASTTLTVEDGKKLFQANCATCHGLNLEGTADGPSLYGVGELAVEFQMSTGRMPLQMQGPQAPQKPVQFTEDQILRSRRGCSRPLPARPSPTRDPRRQGRRRQRRRALPHQLRHVPQRRRRRWCTHRGQVRSRTDVDECPAHVRRDGHGPAEHAGLQQHDPHPDEKRDIISSLLYLQENESAGGLNLGSLGPVSEGLFIWIFGIGASSASPCGSRRSRTDRARGQRH
jgi:ubiquinol-cytochrome c reductase cytochrome c subunit